MFALFLEFCSRTPPQQYPRAARFSQLVNQAEISHLNPRRNWSLYGMLWKWTCELVTDLFQELFHYLGWSLIFNRLQFYFSCLMLRFSSGHVKTKIWGTDKYQIFLWHPTRIQFGAAFQGKYIFKNTLEMSNSEWSSSLFFSNISFYLQLTFEGVRGGTWKGDVAIDNILLYDC